MNRPFLLLRLPYLAIDKSIKLMWIEEQFALSKVSKRSHRVVKCVLRNWKYDVLLNFYEFELLMYIHSSMSHHVITLKDPNSTNMGPIKDTVAQLTNIFAIKILSLQFFEKTCRLAVDLVPFVNQLGVPFRVTAEKFHNEQNDEICEVLLKECSAASELIMEVPVSWEFSPRPDGFGPFHCNNFKCSYSYWITVDHIIKWFMDCRQVCIYNGDFTCSAINQFMRAWQSGSKIETISFHNRTINFTLDEVLEGILGTPARVANVQQGSSVRRASLLTPGPYNGCIIQQNNGQQAFVHLQRSRDLFMHTKFELEKEDK